MPVTTMPCLGARLEDRQAAGNENHTPRRTDDRLAAPFGARMVGCEHQDAAVGLCLCRQRQMDSHLVTIEVGVVGRAGQRMQLQGMALSEDRLEGRTPRRSVGARFRSTGPLLDDVLEDIQTLRTRVTMRFALLTLWRMLKRRASS